MATSANLPPSSGRTPYGSLDLNTFSLSSHNPFFLMFFAAFLSDCTSLERFWSSCLWRLVQMRFWVLQSFLYTLLGCLLYSSMHFDSFWASFYSCNFCRFISYCCLCPQPGWTPALALLILCLNAEVVLSVSPLLLVLGLCVLVHEAVLCFWWSSHFSYMVFLFLNSL